jgi:hypothetical protein
MKISLACFLIISYLSCMSANATSAAIETPIATIIPSNFSDEMAHWDEITQRELMDRQDMEREYAEQMEQNQGWAGDGSGEDDLADYNQNEADDYRDEAADDYRDEGGDDYGPEDSYLDTYWEDQTEVDFGDF